MISTYAKVAKKVDEWLNAGYPMVWVVNPRRRTVKVYRSPADFTALTADEVLDGGDVVEGFQCQVTELFDCPNFLLDVFPKFW